MPASSRGKDALAVLGLALLAAVLVAPTVRGCPGCWSELYDWRYFQAMEDVFRLSIAEYRQAPLWNPYACGGEVGLANPQSTALAPTMLLSLALGTAIGVKAALFVYLFAALAGGYALARALGASSLAAIVAGACYGGSGWFAMHLATGHINFAGAALYPLLILCYLRAVGTHPADGTEGLHGGSGGGEAEPREGRLAWVLPGGALIAWMAALGGTYTVPMGVVLLGTLGATDAARRRSLRPLVAVALLGASALLVGAARFLPLLEFVIDHPRHVGEKDGNNAFDIARMFLAWRQKLEPVSGGHEYWWHEYCCHLPYLAVPLALYAAVHKSPSLRSPKARLPLILAALFLALTIFGLVLPGWERAYGRAYPILRDLYHLLGIVAVVLLCRGTPAFRFMPAAIVGLGIVAGVAWPHGPWWLIRHVPLYRDLRVPARYLILVALVASLLAAWGLDAVRALIAARRGARLGTMVAAVVALLVVGETVAFNWPAYTDSRFVLQREPISPPPPFYQAQSEWRAMLMGILERHGVLKCDEEAPLQRGELDPGPEAEQVRLVDPGAGTAVQTRWTPNELRIDVDLTRPTDVLINQNWNEHWKAHDAAGVPVEVRSLAGRLAVRPAAPTRTTVTLRYRPRSFVVGAWISLAAIPAGAALFVFGLGARRRRPSGGEGGSAVAPRS